MGWLGWTPEVALQSDINLVRMALGSRTRLLKAIFGSAEPGAPGKVTSDLFKAMIARHNRRIAKDGE